MIIIKLLRKIKIYCISAYYKYCFNNIKIGKNLNFRKRFNLNVRKDAKVIIGNNVFFNNDCSINSHKEIEIGDYCIFGENVKIYDHNHIFNKYNELIQEQGFSSKKVVIGSDCWFASNVVILPGAVIGNHVVVGAGCIISGEIENDTIVKVNQVKIYKKIMTKELI